MNRSVEDALDGFCFRSTHPTGYAPCFSPQAPPLPALLDVGAVLGVAVEQQRLPALARADVLLARLAPARMRDFRIDVRPEAVLARLQRFPEALRPLISEAEARDRFDRLEPVLPRHGEPQRGAHRLGDRLAVGA